MPEEDEEIECSRCFRSDIPLQPDPAIECVYFCKPCWQERIRVTAMHEYGYDNDIMEE